MPMGGLLWCDWHTDFIPVPGLNQVVGHTASFAQKAWKDGLRVGNLRCKGGNSWNVDCMGREGNVSFLTFENGVFGAMEVEKPKAYVRTRPWRDANGIWWNLEKEEAHE